MTKTKSEWTKYHPKAIGWWVCADGEKRWVAGRTRHGGPFLEEHTLGALSPMVGSEVYPIRPYVETKKVEVEVEAWACVLLDGRLDAVFSAELVARDYVRRTGSRTVVRLTGTVEIEA